MGYKLSHCLLPILPYYVGQSPTSFFFEASNVLAPNAGFTVFIPLFINTNNSRLRITYQSCVSEIHVLSLRTITIYPLSNSVKSTSFSITLNKCKYDSLPSPAALKYYSHLISALHIKKRSSLKK